MCGRATLVSPAEAVIDALGLDEPLPSFAPRYNIAPGQPVLVLHAHLRGTSPGVVRRYVAVEPWSSEHVNARAETVFGQPAFREAARRRRCGMVADGFYEWRTTDGATKQPFYFQREDGRPFAIAAVGLEDGISVLTAPPTEVVAKVHDRMPLILDEGDLARWIDPASRYPDLAALWRASPRVALRRHPVSRRVNRVENDDPSCSAPADEEPTQGRLF